jgi:NAD(P)-dependent dehydrogenase (short-subunit alcohol dehydrogenase family)
MSSSTTRASAGANRIEDTTLADWERIMAVNATGVFLGTRAVIPAMRRAGGGSIVNISSQLGLVGTDNSSPQYQASKGAVRLLTKATAIQYAKDGIRANSVHPGPIVTAMTERRRADPETYRLTVSRIPLGRYGQPLEVALGVLYLAPTRRRSSPGASWSSTGAGRPSSDVPRSACGNQRAPASSLAPSRVDVAVSSGPAGGAAGRARGANRLRAG